MNGLGDMGWLSLWMLARATECHLDEWLKALALHTAGGVSCDYGGTTPGLGSLTPKLVVPQTRPCHPSRNDSGTQ